MIFIEDPSPICYKYMRSIERFLFLDLFQIIKSPKPYHFAEIAGKVYKYIHGAQREVIFQG